MGKYNEIRKTKNKNVLNNRKMKNHLSDAVDELPN